MHQAREEMLVTSYSWEYRNLLLMGNTIKRHRGEGNIGPTCIQKECLVGRRFDAELQTECSTHFLWEAMQEASRDIGKGQVGRAIGLVRSGSYLCMASYTILVTSST